MAGYRPAYRKVCEVRGEVAWGEDNSNFEPGAVTLCEHFSGAYWFYVRKTNEAAAKWFEFRPQSSITATHDSLTFSEVSESIWGPLPPFTVKPVGLFTVYLRGADQKQLQLFLDKLPDKIKVYRLTDYREQQNLRRQLRDAEQQLREKDEQPENLQRQLREMEQQLRGKDEQQQNLQGQLREREQLLREKDKQQQNLQGNLREIAKQLAHCQGQLMEKEQQLTSLRWDKNKESADFQQKLSVQLEERSNLERELRDRTQYIVDLQKDLSAAKETLSKYESQLRTRDWVLSKNEVQLTKKNLGDGSFGCVFEGRYCGSPVAIKKLHRTSLSPQERSLFEREMDIASRCRHPCLLQFIGATIDESPQFVTELMETSLRALLGEHQLSETELSVISLDVARALNYLHQRKPKPIVHRDVSSANVLLWKQNNQWRGKVSDYGTAKFLEEIMTCAVGALIYRAPEADSRNQTVKMDVYSFGVLVCEMFIRDLPDPDGRDEQVARVTNKDFAYLILWCIEQDPEMRPSMEEIIEKLEQFNIMS